jgi:hypothetical protein
MAVAVPAAAGQRFFEAFFALFVFLSSGASSGFLLVSDVSNLIILISQIPQGRVLFSFTPVCFEYAYKKTDVGVLGITPGVFW